MPSSPHALTMRERGTPVQHRSLSGTVAAGAAIALALLSPACDDEHQDAYFGTDAGADYRLPPLVDARGDGADAGDAADAGDTRDGAASDGTGTGPDAAGTDGPVNDSVPRETNATTDVPLDVSDVAPADATTADIATDLASDLASDGPPVTANDASPG